jgi:hypothetical protein
LRRRDVLHRLRYDRAGPSADLARILEERGFECRRMTQEAGRDPTSIETTLMGPSDDVEQLKRLAGMGVSRAVAMLPFSRPRLDHAHDRSLDKDHAAGERLVSGTRSRSWPR